MATYEDYVLAVKNNVAQRVLRINLLDEDFNITNTLTPKIIDGTISFSSDNGSRRSASITFANEDLSFIPNPVDGLWMNSIIQIFSGYIVDEAEYMYSMGIYILGEPSISSQLSDISVTYQLYDLWCKIDGTIGGVLENTYIVAASTPVEEVVRTVFLAAGETREIMIEPTDALTPYTLILEPSSTYAELLIKLAEMVSYNVFYDNNGNAKFQSPAGDINNVFNAGSSWDFNTGEVVYLGGTRKMEFSKVFNVAKIIGGNVNGEIFDAIAEDLNPTSPTRIDLIGRRPFVLLDDVIYSTQLAQERANYELQRNIQVLEEVSIECIPIPSLESDNVITISDTGLGLSGDRFLIRSINFPLTNGSNMSLSVWLARSFSA